MEELERRRLLLLPKDQRDKGLIVILALRDFGQIPQEITRSRLCKNFEAHTMKRNMRIDAGFRRDIFEVGSYIAERVRTFDKFAPAGQTRSVAAANRTRPITPVSGGYQQVLQYVNAGSGGRKACTSRRSDHVAADAMQPRKRGTPSMAAAHWQVRMIYEAKYDRKAERAAYETRCVWTQDSPEQRFHSIGSSK